MGARKRKPRAYGIVPASVSPALDVDVDAYVQIFPAGDLVAAGYHHDAWVSDRRTLPGDFGVEGDYRFNPVYPRVFPISSPLLAGPSIGWLQLHLSGESGELPPNAIWVWDPEGDETYTYNGAPISGAELGWVILGAAVDPETDYVWWIEREDGQHQEGFDWFTRFRLRRARPTFGGTVVTIGTANIRHPGGTEIQWSRDGEGGYLGAAAGGFQLGGTVARFDDQASYAGGGPDGSPFAIVFPLSGAAAASSFDDDTFGAVALRGFYGTPGRGGLCLGRETYGDGNLYALTLSVEGAAEAHLSDVGAWGAAGADRCSYWGYPTLRVATGAEGLDVLETIELTPYPGGSLDYAYWRPA